VVTLQLNMWQVRHGAIRCLDAMLGLAARQASGASVRQVLRQEGSTPLVAASAMMLQQAAAAEGHAGQSGSKAVRVAALRVLRHLYEAVGDAQALSYILPGAVGGLVKALIQGLSYFPIRPLPFGFQASASTSLSNVGVRAIKYVINVMRLLTDIGETCPQALP
jgi:hypothetical protein